MTGQCTVDRKVLGEDKGEGSAKNRTRRELNMCRRERNSTICRRTNHEAIDAYYNLYF